MRSAVSTADRIMDVIDYDKGGRIGATTVNIAKETNLQPATVRAHLKQLEKYGLVRCTVPPRGSCSARWTLIRRWSK